jgi:hypothetical protein
MNKNLERQYNGVFVDEYVPIADDKYTLKMDSNWFYYLIPKKMNKKKLIKMNKKKLIKRNRMLIMTREFYLLKETFSQLLKVGMFADEEWKEEILAVSKLRNLLERKKMQLFNNLK